MLDHWIAQIFFFTSMHLRKKCDLPNLQIFMEFYHFLQKKKLKSSFFSSNFRRSFSVTISTTTCFTASRSFLRSALLALFAIFTSVASYMFTFCQLFVYNLQRLGKTHQGRTTTTSEDPTIPTTASAASRRAQRRGP